MRRVCTCLAGLLLLMALGACGNPESSGAPGTMMLQERSLSDRETEAVELVSPGEERPYLFDFKTDGTIQTITLRLYTFRFDWEEWELVEDFVLTSKMEQDMTTGSVAVIENQERGSYRLAYSTESGVRRSGNISFMDFPSEEGYLGWSVTQFGVMEGQPAQITVNEEILILAQAFGRGNMDQEEIDYFTDTEELRRRGYDYAVAVTIDFWDG